jgi:phospholipase/carboxylesterase
MENSMLSGPEHGPASGKKPESLIVLLHGLGANGDDLIGLVPMIANQFPTAHFISPNAPSPCDMSPSGYQWFSLRDWSPASMLKGAQEAAPVLNLFLDMQLKRFGLSDDKLALVGFSQGTMMALFAALRRPKPCAGVVGFSGAMIGEEGITSKPPVCLIHGTQDMVVPFGAMGLAEAILKQEGVPVETYARPGVGHSIDPQGLGIATAFLKNKLA